MSHHVSIWQIHRIVLELSIINSDPYGRDSPDDVVTRGWRGRLVVLLGQGGCGGCCVISDRWGFFKKERYKTEERQLVGLLQTSRADRINEMRSKTVMLLLFARWTSRDYQNSPPVKIVLPKPANTWFTYSNSLTECLETEWKPFRIFKIALIGFYNPPVNSWYFVTTCSTKKINVACWVRDVANR